MFGDVHSLHSVTATICLAFQPEEIVVKNARSYRQSCVRAGFIMESVTNSHYRTFSKTTFWHLMLAT